MLAQQIACAVKCWLAGEICISDPRTGAPRAPSAGDIIILVRQRGPLFEAILRALKNAGYDGNLAIEPEWKDVNTDPAKALAALRAQMADVGLN